MIRTKLIRLLHPMNHCKFILLAVLCFYSNSVFAKSDTLLQKINYYISQAKFDSAKVYIQTKIQDPKQVANISNLNYQLVKVLFIQSDYNEALKRAFLSLDNLDDKKESVNFNFLIGCIYSAITDYNKSIKYLDIVVNESTDSSLTVKAHLLLSDLHLTLGDSIQAGDALSAAYDIARQSNLDNKVKNHVSMQYNFFNRNYNICKQQNLKIIADTTSFINAKSYAYSMIGECLIQQDSLLEAIIYFNEFLRLTFEIKDPEQIKIGATKLIEAYEKLGNQEKANAYHKIYNEAMSDSLSFSIDKYRSLYQLEKNRERGIVKTKNTRFYLVIAVVFFSIITFLTYHFNYKTKAKEELAGALEKTTGKKIVISDVEIKKIISAIDNLIEHQLFLTPNITRKSFCLDSKIKSERYLSHYINQKYKKSFSVFINQLRIEYAYNRIQNDSTFRNYRIQEIANDSGFGSKKSFERVFQAEYNITPYKYILSLNT